MSKEPRHEATQSHPSTAVLIDHLIAEFEQAWKAGRHPSIESFAARVPETRRTELIQLLITRDIAYRRERGERWLRTDYQPRFPFLTNSFFQGTEGSDSGDEYRQPFLSTSKHSGPSLGDTELTSPSPPVLTDDGTTAMGSFAAEATMKAASDRYVILRPHARGGLGKISVALDQELNREVALKELQTKFVNQGTARARFILEAEVTGGLAHPGIVPVYGFGMYRDGRPFYAMQLIKGITLKEAIRHLHSKKVRDSTDWEFEQRQLLRRFIDICNSIDYAHSRGVLHRDLKPSNIMLGEFGETLVVDWGLAKIVDRDEISSESDERTLRPSPGSSAVETIAGSAVGTPAYMSPEQAEGRSEDISFTSDVYSLGATLYTILTGRSAFRGKSVGVLEKVRTGNFRPPRSINRKVPPALNAVCMKALALSPSDRYPDCRHLADEIARWLAGEPVAAYPEPIWTRAARWIRRHRTLAISSATAALLLFVLLGAWSWREQARLGKLRAEGTRLLDEGKQLRYEGQLDESLLCLTKASAILGSEPRLTVLKASVQSALGETEQKIAEDEALSLAREKLAEFNRLRDLALFHGTVFTGIDLLANQELAQREVREALALFGIGVESISPPSIPRRYYSALEESEIRSACYELVILYADTIARPFPDQTPVQQSEQAEEAIAFLDRAMVLGTQTQAAHLRRAAYLELAGDNAAAAEQRERAAETPAQSAGAFFHIGLSHLNDGGFVAALDFFAEALVLRPDHFWAQYFSAVCFLELDQPAEAIAHLTATNALRPFVWTHILLGYVRGRLNDYDAAEEEFRRALEFSDNEYSEYGVYVNRGAMRIEQGRLDEAIADLLKAAAINPRQFQAYVNLGEAYRQKKQYDEALRRLDTAIQLSPWVAKSYRVRGLVHLERENLDLALSDFRRALDNEPRGGTAVAELHFEIARILQGKGLKDEALTAYDAAIDAEPGHAKAHRLKGELLVELRRSEEAITSLSRSIDWSDPDAGVLRERAFEHAKLGDHAAAIADYTRALELEPESSTARARRGWALVNEAMKLALDDFEEAIVLDPENGDLYNGRGNARVLLGNYREAVQDAEEALRLGPASPAVREKWTLPYNAACIYSRSVAQLKTDADVAQRESLVDEYQNRALGLLREALIGLGSAAQSNLVQNVFATDTALDPLRALPEFQKLIDEHR